MRTQATFMSRLAAALMILLVAMHLLVALDLFLHFFPETEEFKAMWSIALWAKLFWIAACVVGAASVVLLYHRPWTGFLASVAFCVCLYVASMPLWGGVKGGFWMAVFASLCAGIGALRSNRTTP